jgi:integrase/recombinase XerC
MARPITEDDLEIAIESAVGNVRVWLVLAAWCGLRAKEIALLRAENIRLRDDPPYLLVASDATKGRRERIVPLPPFVVDELTRFGLPFRGLCWRAGHGQPVTPNFVSLVCNRYLHELGIESPLHKLRTRFGTQVHRAVGNIRVTQELLGHTSPATTVIYTEVTDLDKYRAVSKLRAPEVSADAPTIPIRSTT